MTTTIVEVEGVTKYYTQGTNVIKALDGVSLRLEGGDFTAIVGPSGSGKSTLLHVIGLITPQTSGSLRLMGKDISGVKESERHVYRREMAEIFQSFNLIDSFTALENVSVALAAKNVGKKDRESRSKDILKELGLGDRMDHYPGKLSGGEKQRVAIARAMVVNPTILLADEPTGNLDQERGREIIDILFDFNKRGQTILLVTHDNNVATRIGNVITMVDGRITSHDNRRCGGGKDAS